MKKRAVILFILITFLTLNVQAENYAPVYLSKTEFQQDLQYLSQEMLAVHPKFLDESFRASWLASLDSIRRDLPDSLTFNQSYLQMARLVSLLKDGHTSLLFPFSERKRYMQQGGLTMPFTIQVKHDQVVVDKMFGEQLHDTLQGAVILSINNIPAQQVLGKIRPLFGAESQAVTDRMVDRYFAIGFWMFYGEQPFYQLELMDSGRPLSVRLPGVSNSDYFAQRNRWYPRSPQPNYALRFFDGNSFARMTIKTFGDLNGIAQFLRKAFQELQEKECENLIIDVRDNPGGRSVCVDTLLSYLTTKEYRQYASIALRVSPEVKQVYREKKKDIYPTIAGLPIDKLYYFPDTLMEKQPGYQSYAFDGHLFVETNEGTYSAAATFAGVVKHFHLGAIIGQPTGGTIRYYGDFLQFRLPVTGMALVVSPKTFIQLGGNTPEQGVQPDILLDDNTDLAGVMRKCLESVKSKEKDSATGPKQSNRNQSTLKTSLSPDTGITGDNTRMRLKDTGNMFACSGMNMSVMLGRRHTEGEYV